jgi:hypothetical protein
VVRALALCGLLAGIRRDTSALVRNLAAAAQAARAIAETSDVAEITADMLEATIALAQGRAGRARAAAMRALEQARSALDAVHPLTAACLDVVAECERAQGCWSVARVYCDMALALRQSVFGAEHPLTATSWEQLGHIDLDARAYAGARDAFELVTRAVTEGRFVLDPALERPERGRALERFVFRLGHRDREVTLVLRDGFVTEEFIDLARTEGRSAAQEAHLDRLKREMAARLMGRPADEVYDVT